MTQIDQQLDGKPKRSRRPAAETRLNILKKAEDLFRHHGYQQVSMADIALGLQMSPANVFKHFHSKTALVDAIATHHLQDLVAKLKRVSLGPSPSDNLQMLAELLLTTLLEDFDCNEHLFEMIIFCTDLNLEAANTYYDEVSTVLEAIIRDGITKKVFFVTDPAHMARVICTALEGVINPLAVRRDKPEQLYKKCHDVVTLINTALQNSLAK